MKERRRNPHGAGYGRRSTDKIQIPETRLAELSDSTSDQLTLWVERLTGTGFAILGLITLFAALQFFLGGPDTQSALNRELSDSAERIWQASWGIGGILVVVGSLWPRTVIEIVGQYAIAASLITYMVAVVTSAGPVPAFFLTIILLVFVILRIVFLLFIARRLIYILADAPRPLRSLIPHVFRRHV